MIKTKVSKPHEKRFLNHCDAAGLTVSRSGLSFFMITNPADPDTLNLVAVRPDSRHRVRDRQAEVISRLKRAIAAKKLHFMRYDPDNGLQPYDPATEPHYER